MSDLRFDANKDLDVSTKHGEIRALNGRFAIYDSQSTNGTFVNGLARSARWITVPSRQGRHRVRRGGPEGLGANRQRRGDARAAQDRATPRRVDATQRIVGRGAARSSGRPAASSDERARGVCRERTDALLAGRGHRDRRHSRRTRGGAVHQELHAKRPRATRESRSWSRRTRRSIAS